MCGIAGIIAEESQRYEQALQNMVDALRHRGPDESGTDHFHQCSLGHARLSIVDLSTGKQPMRNRGGDVGITFNGEIYGYKALRQELQDYAFHTTSDTEVILALYDRYGKEFLSKLPGMFAFAIWDDRTHALVCARDRFGEKPLYYTYGPQGEFLFASEIKALLASGLVKPILSQRALIHYFQQQYVPPNQTIYKNIHTLPPAHMLWYANGTLSVERYWQLPDTQEPISLTETVEEFRKLFLDAVDRCLIADVPVGAFLSGGLDSSTIVVAASQHKQNLQTFSFGFGKAINELPFAQEVAKQYHTNHTELVAHDYDIGILLQQMAQVYDEPFADSSNIPTFLISQEARRHAKVVLTGDGGDELLAGYDWCYYPLMAMRSPFVQSALLKGIFQTVFRLRKRAFNTVPKAWKLLQKGIQLQTQFDALTGVHCHRKLYFSEDDLRQLGLTLSKYQSSGILKHEHLTTIDEAMRKDLEDYMPGDILVKIDRASMAHGLELRAPFLDVAFASFCISLPERLKISSTNDKIILRQAFAHQWPASIRDRSKQGFGAPISEWLRVPSVVDLVHTYLNDPAQKIFQVLSFEGSRPLIKKMNYKTWMLLVLALWMDHWKFEIET